MYEAVLTVCLSMPIGCVQESGTEYPGSETDGAATAVVTLQVGAAGNVQTRAYGGDGAAIAGEFMNTLELFIVDGQGVVEKVIRATGDANFVPEDNGRLRDGLFHHRDTPNGGQDHLCLCQSGRPCGC